MKEWWARLRCRFGHSRCWWEFIGYEYVQTCGIHTPRMCRFECRKCGRVYFESPDY